jgi:hypothetical protein
MNDSSTPTFENDIKPLFREADREAMIGHFDLWSYIDVTSNAGRILDAISQGSMPCDKPWPSGNVELLERWITAGTPK